MRVHTHLFIIYLFKSLFNEEAVVPGMGWRAIAMNVARAQ